MPEKSKPPLLDFWFFGPERGHLMRTVSIIREMTVRQELRLRLFVHPQHRELARRLLPQSQHTIETTPAASNYPTTPIWTSPWGGLSARS